MATCAKCGNPHERRHRYCAPCFAAYMRDWRRKHPKTYDRRAIARSYAGVYKRRGKLVERPCEICGAKAEMQHLDYDRPLLVRWLCREHRRKLARDRPA